MPKPILEIIVRKTYRVRPLALLKAREAAGLSQDELAQRLDMFGWSQQNISDIEGELLPHHIDRGTVEKFKEIGFKINFTPY